MKRSFKDYVRLYFMMISQDFKSKMQYRADFIISSLGMILINISGIVTFWLIFNSIPSIAGFSYHQLVFMYGFSLLAVSPMQLFFDNLWSLWIHTENGDFIKYCFKPVNLFFYFIAETFDVKGIGQGILGIVALVYGWIKLGIPVTVENILMLILMIIGSSLVFVGIMIFAAASSFILLNGVSIMSFFVQFKEYAIYPLSIYNKAVKFIFTFILPIGFIAYYPARFFINTGDGLLFSLLTPVAGIVVFYVSYKLWMFCARRYAGTGS